jgi:carbon storage regulator
MDRGGADMLVISRKSGEKVRIGEDVAIAILEISGSRVVLGIEAPRDIPVRRLDHRSRLESEPAPSMDADAVSLEGVQSTVQAEGSEADREAVPARAALPFEYPTRISEEPASVSKKVPVVRVRRSRKIALPTDPAAD